MKHILLVLIVTMTYQIYSQTIYGINLTFKSDVQGDLMVNRFGVRSDATDGLDAGIESERFPAAQPGGLLPLFMMFDEKQGETVGSYVDFKKLEDSAFYTKVYNYKVIRNATDAYRVEWNKFSVPRIVDSAFVRDLLTGGKVFNVNMKENDFIAVNNPGISDLIFVVHYNNNPSSINQLKDNVIVNLFDNTLQVDNCESFTIFDTLGRIILESNNNGTFNLGNLNKGVYFCITTDYNGQRQTHKLIQK